MDTKPEYSSNKYRKINNRYISVNAVYMSLGNIDKTLQDIFLDYCMISRDLNLNLIQIYTE